MKEITLSTVDDIKLKSLRDGRARKFGKYEVLRDLITTDGNEIAINDTLCSINEAGSVFKVLVNQLKKKSRKDKEYKLFVWVMHGSLMAKILHLSKVTEANIIDIFKDRKGIIQYLVTEHFIFKNWNNLLGGNDNIDNIYDTFAIPKTLSRPLAMQLVIEHSRPKAPHKPYKYTRANLVFDRAYELMSFSAKHELIDEVCAAKRCPSTGIIKDLIRASAAGVLFTNDNYRYKYLKNVYDYDMDSCYTSQLFADCFPLGELKRVKWDLNTFSKLWNSDYWYIVQGVSDKEYYSLQYRPVRQNGKYYYTLTPWDFKGFVALGINPFSWDIAWNYIAYTSKVGMLNHNYLDWLMKLHELKSSAGTEAERKLYKDTLNFIIGKGHSVYLSEMNNHVRWYLDPKHYMCPQFSITAYSRARYNAIRLMNSVGMDNTIAIVTDCIRTPDSRITVAMEAENEQTKAYMQRIGYGGTSLGLWKYTNDIDFIQFTNNVYFYSKMKNNELVLKPVFSGCNSMKFDQLQTFEDIFKNVNIINGHTKKTDVYGVTAYSDFPLWPDEETMDKQHYIWKVMNDGFAMAEPF